MTIDGLPRCEESGKLCYPSVRAAKAAIKAMKRNRRDGGGLLMAYRCGSHFHVGHGRPTGHRVPGRKFR